MVGLVASITFTYAVAVELLPRASVEVMVTVFTPTCAQLNEEGVIVVVGLVVQASLTVAKFAKVTVPVPFAPKTKLKGAV